MLGAFDMVEHRQCREFLIACQTKIGGFGKTPGSLPGKWRKRAGGERGKNNKRVLCVNRRDAFVHGCGEHVAAQGTGHRTHFVCHQCSVIICRAPESYQILAIGWINGMIRNQREKGRKNKKVHEHASKCPFPILYLDWACFIPFLTNSTFFFFMQL